MICGPERGLDWRGVAYAVVLTAQGSEGGQSTRHQQQGLRRDERGLEHEGKRTRNGGEVWWLNMSACGRAEAVTWSKVFCSSAPDSPLTSLFNKRISVRYPGCTHALTQLNSETEAKRHRVSTLTSFFWPSSQRKYNLSVPSDEGYQPDGTVRSM